MAKRARWLSKASSDGPGGPRSGVLGFRQAEMSKRRAIHPRVEHDKIPMNRRRIMFGFRSFIPLVSASKGEALPFKVKKTRILSGVEATAMTFGRHSQALP